MKMFMYKNLQRGALHWNYRSFSAVGGHHGSVCPPCWMNSVYLDGCFVFACSNNLTNKRDNIIHIVFSSAVVGVVTGK